MVQTFVTAEISLVAQHGSFMGWRGQVQRHTVSWSSLLNIGFHEVQELGGGWISGSTQRAKQHTQRVQRWKESS